MDGIVKDFYRLLSVAWGLLNVIVMMLVALVACSIQLALRILIQLFEWAAWPFACAYAYLKTYGGAKEGPNNVA